MAVPGANFGGKRVGSNGLIVACGCACIYFICKVVYCNKQPFLSTSMTIWCVY